MTIPRWFSTLMTVFTSYTVLANPPNPASNILRFGDFEDSHAGKWTVFRSHGPDRPMDIDVKGVENGWGVWLADMDVTRVTRGQAHSGRHSLRFRKLDYTGGPICYSGIQQELMTSVGSHDLLTASVWVYNPPGSKAETYVAIDFRTSENRYLGGSITSATPALGWQLMETRTVVPSKEEMPDLERVTFVMGVRSPDEVTGTVFFDDAVVSRTNTSRRASTPLEGEQ